MKTIKYVFLLMFLFGALIIQSCKKDLSSLDIKNVGNLTVDTQADGVLDVLQFEHLVLNPKTTTTIDEANLSYQWRINLKPSDTLSQVISTAKNLDAEIKLVPNKFEIYYQLWYEVTDKITGLKYITTWKVNVRNAIGEGLVIAETAADGVSSDISHLMSPLVTAGFTGESIKHGLYSGINLKTIPGIVKQMRFTNIFGINTIMAITNNSIVKINTLDYTLGGTNDDLFFGHTGTFAPEGLYGAYQGDIYIEKNTFTFTYLGASKKFGLAYDNAFKVPGIVAVNKNSNPPTILSFYDEVNGYFAYQGFFNAFGDRTVYRYPVSATPFNPNSLPNKTNLAAIFDTNYDILHLLKDKTSGNVGLYTFSGNVPGGAPKAFYDFSAAPNIATASKFVLMDNQKVLYYATETKIYAVLYAGATPIYEERYTVPAGEKITTLDIYQQADYPVGTTYLTSNNNQLILTTYNTEGKLYILPLKNLGAGNIDLPNVKTYGGFKKITAITTQK